MPWWLSVGEVLIKGLIWWYGHREVVAKVTKYKPLPPDPLPSPKASREPKAPWLHTGDSIADASE